MPCGGMHDGLAGIWAIGGALLKEGKTAPNAAKDLSRCPNCAWKITVDFDWCPSCGLRLKPYQCGYCRGTVMTSAQECPRCGAPVH